MEIPRRPVADLVSEPTAHQRGDDTGVVHHVHGHLADGTFRDATAADVFTFRDGVVVRMQAYADPAQAFSACSLKAAGTRAARSVGGRG
jgi:ketosteroid isomerase-like protein